MSSSTQPAAVITGASQGIGAALVTAYRKLGYAVVANSRSITPSDDPGVATVPGDIAEPAPPWPNGRAPASRPPSRP